ncbi:MAG: NAD(P)-dependent oxidoreductase [Pirellulales bacterium]|nr:NAD(P)-dependent oxidoreductase [Pirellulales bacterium]
MPSRALITGVSGFVGGFLAEHLLACGDSVLGASPDGAWLPESDPEIRDSIPLVGWDLGRDERPDGEALTRIERFAPEAIYHLAALSVPDECGRDEPTPRAWAVNVEGTRRVVELAAALPSRPRVIAIGSSHVYAPVDPKSPTVNEDAPLGPARGYGQTKLAAERLALELGHRRGVQVVVARAFPHTGPRQNPPMMLPQWARQFALETETPVEVHTRDAWIDLSDVRDVVRAYRLLTSIGHPGTVYNVGSGRNRRSGDVLDALRALAGPNRPVVELRPGRKQDPIADITRLSVQTGWTPKIPLDQTVADTWAFWRDWPDD